MTHSNKQPIKHVASSLQQQQQQQQASSSKQHQQSQPRSTIPKLILVDGELVVDKQSLQISNAPIEDMDADAIIDEDVC